MREIKEFFRPIYDYINNPMLRNIYSLMNNCESLERFSNFKVEFLKYKLSIPDNASFLSQIREIFLSDIYKIKLKTDKPIILDCGSNIGLSVLYLNKLYPNSLIIAYEADKKIFDYLSYNILNNITNTTNISLINKAVWIDDNGVRFHSDLADGGSIFSEADSKTIIPSICLKDEIVKFEHIDFLKMDIEGAEIAVLSDCKEELYRVDFLFVEYHAFRNSKQELDVLLSILTNAGFRYYLDDIQKINSPLVSLIESKNAMDLQLNIFAYRV